MSIKVLVADDSITIQKVIGIIFGGDEYSLTIVDNGNSAVDKAREINPDILLIDALMPGMTGYEVSETIRSIPALAAKPILILTGSFEPFDEEKAKRCGADDFIAKPFESQQIITKVRELLEIGKSREFSAPVSEQPSPIEVSHDQIYEIATPSLDVQTSVESRYQAAPENIWAAFTPETEQESVAETASAPTIPTADAFEPDVFAIVSEESDAQLVQSPVNVGESPQDSGSQWESVQEHTFEFEEETIAAPPQSDFTYPAGQPLEPSFGNIAFEDETETSAAPVLDAFTSPLPIFEAPATSFAPLTDHAEPLAAPVEKTFPVTETASQVPASLTEEQLRTALASVSKEVIERIVWEVVPDLAEVLIREAIRKIKQEV